MIRLRPAGERGHFDFGWLDTHHTFSFGDYDEPEHRGFRQLRVINEDRVRPGRGFPPHGHRDMEILTWVLEGRLEHRDSLGNGSVIGPGELQRMSAGTGIQHAEYNASQSDPLHFLQIWVLPEARGGAPGYEQKSFPAPERQDRLRLLASRGGREGSVRLRQDADVYAATLSAESGLEHALAPGRHAWLQLTAGALDGNGTLLRAGDGAAVSNEPRLRLRPVEACEFLLFDLA